jgi:hypothetical protein
MKLSEHFDLEEFAVSASHPELVEPVPAEYIPTVIQLVESVLEPARVAWGRGLTVLSGYRSPRLNDAVRGSPTSQHRLAQAADIQPGDARAFFYWLMTRPQLFPTGQVILYPDRGFVHVALPSKRFPTPTFCVQWPAQKLRYYALKDVAELDELVPA